MVSAAVHLVLMPVLARNPPEDCCPEAKLEKNPDAFSCSWSSCPALAHPLFWPVSCHVCIRTAQCLGEGGGRGKYPSIPWPWICRDFFLMSVDKSWQIPAQTSLGLPIVSLTFAQPQWQELWGYVCKRVTLGQSILSSRVCSDCSSDIESGSSCK